MVSVGELFHYARENGIFTLFKGALCWLNLFCLEKKILLCLSLEGQIKDIKPLLDVQIRKAKIDDINEIHKMPRYSWNRPSREELRNWILNGYPFFLAIYDNKIVGYLCNSLEIPRKYRSLMEFSENDAWGQDAFVIPFYRGKRIYSALGIEAMKATKALGYRKIFSIVTPWNSSARAAHKKIGNKEIREVDLTGISFFFERIRALTIQFLKDIL